MLEKERNDAKKGEKKHRGRRILLRTYGCQMNDYDSDKLMALLAEEGYTKACNPEEADYIIVNTCSVRKHAEHRAISFLSSLKNLNDRNNKTFCLIGCMANLHKEQLLRKYKFIDIVCGPNNYKDLPSILSAGRRACFTGDSNDPFIETPPCNDGKVSASVSITKGCENFCSYCIVPFTRGMLVSKKPCSVLSEIHSLVEQGVKEIFLLGQNVNEYGRDTGQSFVSLLEKVHEIAGLERFGFLTSHPKDIPDNLIDSFKNLPKLYKHLHLPMQSGSAKILGLMNRKYNPDSYFEIINRARNTVDGINISSDIIVGFPSETGEDFSETLEAVRKIEFDDLFIFKYSARPGTRAAELNDDVSVQEKELRHKLIMDLQSIISLSKNKAAQGQVQEIFIRRQSLKKPGNFLGRNIFNKTVMVKAAKLEIGTVKQVHIVKGGRHYLEGLPCVDHTK